MREKLFAVFEIKVGDHVKDYQSSI
jgi:hypothetical protein